MVARGEGKQMMTTQEAWQLYGKYAEAWKAISDEQRMKILAEVLDEDIHYFTPDFQGGFGTVIEDMVGFQKKLPGARFEVEDVSTHHDVGLLTWVLVQSDGNVLGKGHDQIRVTEKGRIVSLTTFAPSVPKP
jgi:hypothetical protein